LEEYVSVSDAVSWHIAPLVEVSISKRENWTPSKMRDRADVLIELLKWIEEKSFEVQKYPSLRDLLS